ncbi:MAG: bifunctional N-acetylglucosamine-1-phosphate uridyltransferase/glucosamine-1-phosphate acetyltransferase [Rhodobacterales bacterium]|nr:MAG: bifunctional N-acetylglucosamine-1-phosphate uridyltransferase/glucosamine-1-phosphate acetyltransferase [Rhodobacterales bacterium]
MTTALIVLAAGQGTRMNSDLPKVLHPLGGVPLVVHAMASGSAVAPEKTVVVAGHGADRVTPAVLAHDPAAAVVRQDQQLGTGHAVLQAADALDGFAGDAIVVFGDTPFVRPETIAKMAEARAGGDDIVMLGFEAADPGRYGRMVLGDDGLERIVEAKDASDQELALTLCNGGLVAADAKTLFDLLRGLGNDNASGEYYLTDIVQAGRAQGLKAGVVICEESETLGINTRAELARAEQLLQQQKRREALENGVTLLAPDTVFFSYDSQIGRDAVVEQNVVFGPGVSVETGATIRAFSHLEGCHVAQGAVVGPYARLRPGTELNENTKVGNFVEVKNAVLEEGAKVNHLSYIGDAAIGARSNIGAGTITCNYDGYMKHRTEIGRDSFIGSNTMLVAPVTIGDEAMSASGSVITGDVPDGALALGRARQVTKPGLARKMFGKLKKTKEKLQKGAE